MPSTLPLPTIDELVQAAHDGVKARRNREDGHDGSAYDYLFGSSAILFSQQAQRDRDLFRAIFVDYADSADLTNLVSSRYDIERVLDTYGTGFATLKRASAAYGADTAWAGTRIKTQSASSNVGGGIYVIASDTPIAAPALYAVVPVRASVTGPGVAYDSTNQPLAPVLDDPLGDSTWTVASLRCADGTSFEPAQALRARLRDTRKTNRVGYADRITYACQQAGAASVAVFNSNFGGSDLHMCATYVGDAGFTGNAALVNACKIALEGIRMCGADMHVGAMASAVVPITATVSLWDQLAAFDIISIKSAIVSSLQGAFGATDAYGCDIDALGAAIANVSDEIQSVTLSTPSSSQTVLSGGAFPQVLNRYKLDPSQITLTFTGPQ